MATVARKQAPRPAKPVGRYWRGKAPKGVEEQSDTDEDEQQEEADEADEDEDLPLAEVEDGSDEEDEDEDRPTKTAAGKMSIALKDVDIKDGKVIVAGREESGRTAIEGMSYHFPSQIYHLLSTLLLQKRKRRTRKKRRLKDKVRPKLTR